jgi:hypothetical protein
MSSDWYVSSILPAGAASSPTSPTVQLLFDLSLVLIALGVTIRLTAWEKGYLYRTPALNDQDHHHHQPTSLLQYRIPQSTHELFRSHMEHWTLRQQEKRRTPMIAIPMFPADMAAPRSSSSGSRSSEDSSTSRPRRESTGTESGHEDADDAIRNVWMYLDLYGKEVTNFEIMQIFLEMAICVDGLHKEGFFHLQLELDNFVFDEGESMSLEKDEKESVPTSMDGCQWNYSNLPFTCSDISDDRISRKIDAFMLGRCFECAWQMTGRPMPLDLEALIGRMTAVDAIQRPNISEVLAELRNLLDES